MQSLFNIQWRFFLWSVKMKWDKVSLRTWKKFHYNDRKPHINLLGGEIRENSGSWNHNRISSGDVTDREARLTQKSPCFFRLLSRSMRYGFVWRHVWIYFRQESKNMQIRENQWRIRDIFFLITRKVREELHEPFGSVLARPNSSCRFQLFFPLRPPAKNQPILKTVTLLCINRPG